MMHPKNKMRIKQTNHIRIAHSRTNTASLKINETEKLHLGSPKLAR